MLKYKLIELNESQIIYEYYPEGKDEKCTLTVTRDGEVVDRKSSELDQFGSYFAHMILKINKFIENQEFKEEGIIAWY